MKRRRFRVGNVATCTPSPPTGNDLPTTRQLLRSAAKTATSGTNPGRYCIAHTDPARSQKRSCHRGDTDASRTRKRCRRNPRPSVPETPMINSTSMMNCISGLSSRRDAAPKPAPLRHSGENRHEHHAPHLLYRLRHECACEELHRLRSHARDFVVVSRQCPARSARAAMSQRFLPRPTIHQAKPSSPG